MKQRMIIFTRAQGKKPIAVDLTAALAIFLTILLMLTLFIGFRVQAKNAEIERLRGTIAFLREENQRNYAELMTIIDNTYADVQSALDSTGCFIQKTNVPIPLYVLLDEEPDAEPAALAQGGAG